MGTFSITITVKDADTGGTLGGVEVELVGVAVQSTVGGVARFTVEEGVGYDLKVRSPQLRPAYKDSGELWLTEYVEQKVDSSARGRYRQLAGQALVWGVTFSESSEGLKNYDVQMKRQLRRAGAVSATPGGKVVFDKPALEDVIVVGTNVHDNSYGNKTMFLAQAVRAIRSRYSGDAFVSLLVYADGYTAGEIDEAKAAATGFNGNLVFQKLSSTLRHPSQSNKVIWNRNGAFSEPVAGKTPVGLHDNGGGGVFVFRKGMTPSNE